MKLQYSPIIENSLASIRINEIESAKAWSGWHGVLEHLDCIEKYLHILESYQDISDFAELFQNLLSKDICLRYRMLFDKRSSALGVNLNINRDVSIEQNEMQWHHFLMKLSNGSVAHDGDTNQRDAVLHLVQNSNGERIFNLTTSAEWLGGSFEIEQIDGIRSLIAKWKQVAETKLDQEFAKFQIYLEQNKEILQKKTPVQNWYLCKSDSNCDSIAC